MKPTNHTYPTPTEAEKILQEAEACNSGPWGDHSRVTAKCAAKIAALCPELEMLKKLEESRKHVDQGMFKDADAVSRNLRTKYGL